jgi:RNA polymerase-binding transcription factor DksA
MAGLSPQQIDHLSQLMDQRWTREFKEIRSLIDNVAGLRERVALGERPSDPSDEALLHTLATVDEAQIRQNTQDVRDIVTARQRIAAGKYGTCTDCDADIDYERLLVYPTAKRCINCQREHEEKKARAAGRGG